MRRRIIWTPTGSLPMDLFRLGCHGLTGLILVSFAGRFLPLGDSLAVFRIELTLLSAIFGAVALWLGRTSIPVISAGMVVVTALSILPFAQVRGGAFSGPITVHQHNVFFNNTDRASLVDAVRTQMPMAVTLQELGTQNAGMIGKLAETHKHYHVCSYTTGGVGVFVQDVGPMLGSGCVEKAKLAWVQVETGQGPVTFVSIHLFWPWPKGQFVQVDDYVAMIEALPQPIVLGGDFNMVPWAVSVARIADAAGAEVVPGLAPSYHIRGGWPFFRIDHVLAPEGWQSRSRRLGKLGSDHNGVWAEIEGQ